MRVVILTSPNMLLMLLAVSILQHSAQAAWRCVLVTFKGQQYVGEIIRFFRVLPPPQLNVADAAAPQPLCLVICHFFNPLGQQGQVSGVNTSIPKNGGGLRGVVIAKIDSALFSAIDPNAGAGGGGQQLRLVRCYNSSRQ
jgi:hypothetical protein